MKRLICACISLSISLLAYAGGNPEYVKLPEAYQTEFTKYDTLNRKNGKQVAVLYANKAAIDSASETALGEGAILIMEVYKTITGDDGKPIADENGLFQKDKLAAIAVMEKRKQWDAAYAVNDRLADWGFAIYKADGSVKENDLYCVACHPLSAARLPVLARCTC